MPKNNELDLLQESLNKLKNQIDAMQEREKYENESKKTFRREILKGDFKEQFETLQYEIANLLKNKLNENSYDTEESAKSISTCITASKFSKASNFISTSIFYNEDDINENGIAAALEPFTNPNRILILKCLIYKPLSANEISQSTRLVGGQLYHHLAILESAELIEKTSDKYALCDHTLNFLSSLSAVLGGLNISKK